MKFKLLFLGLALALWSCGDTAPKATEGVTENGFKYTLHTAETGSKPADGDFIYFHVQRRTGDEVLMSTRTEGAGTVPSMPYTKIPPKGQEDSPYPYVMGLLSVGDSITVEVVLDTLPQEQLPEDLKGKSTLFLDIVVVDIVDKEANDAKQKEEQEKTMAERAEKMKAVPAIEALVAATLGKYKSGALDADIVTLPSGLKIYFHEKTDGKMPTVGQTVGAQYYGVLVSDGSEFDNSFKRGQQFAFPVGQGRVIKGWDEGFLQMPEGSKATLFIPYDLAYGERGSPPNIPAKADLMFYVELENIQ